MQVSVDKIFDYLSLDNSDEIQNRGIELASQIKHLSVLIMPIEDKSIWENCAKVLISKSDEELQLYFIKLFEWLKDMNWPGAYLIYDRLICVSSENLLIAYRYSLSLAKQTQDCVWEMVLNDFFIAYIFNLLDWHKPDKIQSKGRKLAQSVETVIPFIQPLIQKYNKNVWENCAVILAERKDEELKPYLVKILEWLQDMNWPGAFCILSRLQGYSDVDSIQCAINICAEKAKSCNDETWEYNLNMLMQKFN